MKITDIPDVVYLRAIELEGSVFKKADGWTAKEEWELICDRKGFEDGELNQAISEHIIKGGEWSEE